MGSHLFVAGVAHGIEGLVGKCSIPKELRSEAEKIALESCDIEETLVLSTCNRVEFYFVGSSDLFDPISAVKCIYKKLGKEDLFVEFSKNAKIFEDGAAIVHLFAVASGLESQITGETEIFGQVKAAYARAFEAGHCGHFLNSTFQKAAQCGKWVRTNTDVGHGKITVGSVASELASRIFDDVKTAKILLLGSGEVGKSVAESLLVRGCNDVTVASRTRENAQRLADESGLKWVDFTESLGILDNFDIIICASASPTPPLSFDIVNSSLEKRAGKSLFIIDLGSPRNCSKECETLDGVYVYTLDDLSNIANKNLELRRAEIERATAEVNRKASNLASKLFK